MVTRRASSFAGMPVMIEKFDDMRYIKKMMKCDSYMSH